MERMRLPGSGGVTLTGDIGGDPSRQPVILSHGGGQTRGAWGAAAAKLVERGYHVLSLDMRGHGESDWAPDGDYGMNAFVGDLEAVASRLAKPPALVGASMGGMASMLAAGGGMPVAALVLVDIVPKINPQGAGKIGAFMTANPDGFATLEEASDAVAAYQPHRPRPKDPSGLMRNLREGPNGRLFWHWDPAFMLGVRDTDGTARRMEAAAPAITAPTLLVRGQQSDVVDDEGVAHFRALIPNSEYVDVEGAGHMVAGDRNDAFNRAIFDFLGRVAPP